MRSFAKLSQLVLFNLITAVKRLESVNQHRPGSLQRGNNDGPVDRQQTVSNYGALCIWLICQAAQILTIQKSQLSSKQIVSNVLAMLLRQLPIGADNVSTL